MFGFSSCASHSILLMLHLFYRQLLCTYLCAAHVSPAISVHPAMCAPLHLYCPDTSGLPSSLRSPRLLLPSSLNAFFFVSSRQARTTSGDTPPVVSCDKITDCTIFTTANYDRLHTSHMSGASFKRSQWALFEKPCIAVSDPEASSQDDAMGEDELPVQSHEHIACTKGNESKRIRLAEEVVR